MDFLTQQNKRVRGRYRYPKAILATGKHVIIIGGGDTGADCLGTSHRQKARSRTSVRDSAQASRRRARRRRRGRCGRCNCASKARTKRAACASGRRHHASSKATRDGNVKKLHGVRVAPAPKFEPITGTEFTLDADLVLLAMGFTGPVKTGLIEQLGVKLDPRGNIATDGITSRRFRACSRRATCAAGSRWWCGRSPKAARRRKGSIVI